MNGLVIGSGYVSRRVLEIGKNADVVICADGGYDSAKKYNIEPDIVIGDMDSIESEPKAKTIVYPCEKDETDSEIAVCHALDMGCKSIVLAGFTGSRADHTLNNILMLKRIKERGAEAVIVDDHNEIYYFKDEISLFGKEGELLSIIPVNGDVCGIITEGLKYKLSDETLFFGRGRGVSNVFLTDSCKITAKSGEAVVIKSRD